MREDPAPPSGTSPESDVHDPQYPALPVKTATVIKIGMLVWAVVLVVTLAVPELRTGERGWWPWTAVAGLILGIIGYLYVRRGRGNAAGVE
ncbi:MAG: DUF2530 domain-containing protein [Dermatophilaceae bacterium]|nr:DUF2530 domain-containing protein [Intrasporangiaceae bacterium]